MRVGVGVGGDRRDDDLHGRQPKRQRTGIVFEQDADEALEGAEDRVVRWKSRSSEREMAGLSYLLHQMLPNLHFHCTTAYAILRHNGVELGKMDYLGK